MLPHEIIFLLKWYFILPATLIIGLLYGFITKKEEEPLWLYLFLSFVMWGICALVIYFISIYFKKISIYLKIAGFFLISSTLIILALLSLMRLCKSAILFIKNIFTPKWKSKYPGIRSMWIASANPVNNKNQKIFAELAKNDENFNVRLEAVKKLIDQGTLAFVAKNEEYSYVREIAVRKITDQAVLAEVAKSDKDYNIRKIAFEKAGLENSQDALANKTKNISKSTTFVFSEETAFMNKFMDQGVLADMAKNALNSTIRKKAIEKLTDQAVLADVAINDEDSDVRKAAVKKVTDQNVLNDIAKNDSDYKVRKIAYEKLKIENTLDAIVDIAINDDNSQISRDAASKLTDNLALTRVIKNTKHSSLCYELLEKIVEPELLRSIVTIFLNKFPKTCLELKILFNHKFLSQQDKLRILKLQGNQIKAHSDSGRQYHSDQSCYVEGDRFHSDSHVDNPAEYFTL
jgi:hypothetical protein